MRTLIKKAIEFRQSAIGSQESNLVSCSELGVDIVIALTILRRYTNFTLSDILTTNNVKSMPALREAADFYCVMVGVPDSPILNNYLNFVSELGDDRFDNFGKAINIDQDHEIISVVTDIYENILANTNADNRNQDQVFCTPTPVADFIINGVNYMLQKHFDSKLGDDHVKVFDFAAGSGMFILKAMETALKNNPNDPYIKQTILRNFAAVEIDPTRHIICYLLMFYYLRLYNIELDEKDVLCVLNVNTLKIDSWKEYYSSADVSPFHAKEMLKANNFLATDVQQIDENIHFFKELYENRDKIQPQAYEPPHLEKKSAKLKRSKKKQEDTSQSGLF